MTEQLQGSLERITYRNDETGYTVAQVKVTGRRQLVAVVGKLPTIQPGESIRVTGSWVVHRSHGQQFEADSIQTIAPDSQEAIVRYLSAGLLPGVGSVMAQRIVDEFGMETLKILDTEPQKLRRIHGLGSKKLAGIISAWQEQRSIRGLLELGQSVGLAANQALRIYRTYGAMAETIVRNDPYRLALEIEGISFPTADQIAQSLGIAKNEPSRILAGLRYSLTTAAYEDGHCALVPAKLLERAQKLLTLPQPEIAKQLVAATELAILIDDQGLIFSPGLYYAETEFANQIKRLQASPTPIATVFKQYERDSIRAILATFNTSEDQITAITTALESPVMILTGGPGTGKTTSVQAILASLKAEGFRALLAAPTGRAARRLAEATGHAATTVHRLLEYSGGGSNERWGRNDVNPLETDMVIIDEASMLDLPLAHRLVQAIRPGTQLVLVGDADQLPSVGPGAIMRDMLASTQIAHVALQHIFRQAMDSAIVENAHLINHGDMPLVNSHEGFYWFARNTAEACADMVVELVTERIPRQFPQYDPANDIQVLAATHRGPVGVAALNERLQAKLNPAHSQRKECSIAGNLFREGDRVLQLRNNYELDVSNGDLGVLSSIDEEMRTATIQYDDTRTITYTWTEMDDITLAYAISVHKAQGGEYPVVVIPLMTYYHNLLNRPLIYTAVTRARQVVVLTGQVKALERAIRTTNDTERQTGLEARLEA